jgi:hypothetical protein
MPPLHIVKPTKKRSKPAREPRTKATRSGSDTESETLRRIRDLKPKAVDRQRAALRRLGVSRDELSAAPDISGLLKQAKGGLTATLQAMRFSQHPDVLMFLEKYDSIPARDRASLPWEAVALAAEVNLTTLLGGAVLALQAHSANTVKIIALTNHSTVTESRIRFAQLPGGFKDRDAIDTALGFLPTSKGSTFIINPQSKKDDHEDEAEDEDSETVLDHLFPNLKQTQETMVPLRARSLGNGNE